MCLYFFLFCVEICKKKHFLPSTYSYPGGTVNIREKISSPRSQLAFILSCWFHTWQMNSVGLRMHGAAAESSGVTSLFDTCIRLCERWRVCNGAISGISFYAHELLRVCVQEVLVLIAQCPKLRRGFLCARARVLAVWYVGFCIPRVLYYYFYLEFLWAMLTFWSARQSLRKPKSIYLMWLVIEIC